MYQHWQMTLAMLLCLSTTAIIVAVPAVLPGIAISGHQRTTTFYCTGTVYFGLMVDPRDGFVGWDDGIPPRQGSAVVEGHCCCAGSPAKISSQSPRAIPAGIRR